jgi:hypothetical protein
MVNDASDPILTAVAARADELFARVESLQVHPHDAMAVLIADTFGIAVEPGLNIDTANQLVEMCSQWALQRRHAMQADLALQQSPVPDDVSEIDRDTPEV